MIYFAVIDTNVIVSAMLKKHSIPSQILNFAMNGVIVPILDKRITAEYCTVLSRPKFNFSRDDVENVINEIERHSIYMKPKTINQEFVDVSDKKFYDLLMTVSREHEAYLITGNIKYFPDKFYILTPRQMMDIIAQDAEAIDIDLNG